MVYPTPEKLAYGRTPCQHCQALLLPNTTHCRFCNKPTNPIPPKTTRRKKLQPQPAPTITTWEWETLGKPITQGSGTAIAAGVYKHNHAEELKPWRQAIEDAFREKYGNHQPIQQPVFITAIFTVPRPKSHPKNTLMYPTGGGDLDKLFRAAGDAISPRTNQPIKTGPNRHKLHLPVIPDDNLIVDLRAVKTYPAPYNTHPGALTEPGARIRVQLAPDPKTLIRNY